MTEVFHLVTPLSALLKDRSPETATAAHIGAEYGE
jgi:hypothetical protein